MSSRVPSKLAPPVRFAPGLPVLVCVGAAVVALGCAGGRMVPASTGECGPRKKVGHTEDPALEGSAAPADSSAPPDGGVTATAAVPEDVDLSTEERRRLAAAVAPAAECLPKSDSGGRVVVRGTLVGGRIQRSEVRSERELAPAVESCILGRLEQARVEGGTDSLARSFEVTLDAP